MKRPNIILIITDQQRYDTIAALGYPHLNTPHTDRLVNEGVALHNATSRLRLVGLRGPAFSPVIFLTIRELSKTMRSGLALGFRI